MLIGEESIDDTVDEAAEFQRITLQPGRAQELLQQLMQFLTIALLLASASISVSAVTFNGSGTSGFGGAIGGSSMTWTDDGTNISVSVTKGAGNLDDIFVIYFDTGSSGRNTVGTEIEDRDNLYRGAISYLPANTLTLPVGFETKAALAIGVNNGYFYSIPTTGFVSGQGLIFIGLANSTLADATQSTFEFSIPVATLGIASDSGATINFVATYSNPFDGPNGEGRISNEGYGGLFPVANVDQNNLSLTSSLSYTIIPEPTGVMLSIFGAIGILRRRR